MLEVILLPSLEEQQHMLGTMLNMLDLDLMDAQHENTNKFEFSAIPVSALVVEKINQDLFKASEFHEENSRKSWSEASRYYAAK